jgi:hypothetical protein
MIVLMGCLLIGILMLGLDLLTEQRGRRAR